MPAGTWGAPHAAFSEPCSGHSTTCWRHCSNGTWHLRPRALPLRHYGDDSVAIYTRCQRLVFDHRTRLRTAAHAEKLAPAAFDNVDTAPHAGYVLCPTKRQLWPAAQCPHVTAHAHAPVAALSATFSEPRASKKAPRLVSPRMLTGTRSFSTSQT